MTDQGVAMLKRTVGELHRLTDNVKPEQLADQTPCTDWKVRDLLNHLCAGGTLFAISAEQGSVPDDVLGKLFTEDQLGDDYKRSVRDSSNRAVRAFEQPGVMEKTVTLPFGAMPAPMALNIAIFDVTTHLCDLARATGQSVDDAELLDAALAMGEQMDNPQLRQPGVLGPKQAAATGASTADRLLAFAGRSV